VEKRFAVRGLWPEAKREYGGFFRGGEKVLETAEIRQTRMGKQQG